MEYYIDRRPYLLSYPKLKILAACAKPRNPDRRAFMVGMVALHGISSQKTAEYLADLQKYGFLVLSKKDTIDITPEGEKWLAVPASCSFSATVFFKTFGYVPDFWNGQMKVMVDRKNYRKFRETWNALKSPVDHGETYFYWDEDGDLYKKNLLCAIG